MDFEWNPQKADINQREHGITFEEASTVFGDVLSVTFPDPDHSIQEERFLLLGVSSKNRVLLISHVYRAGTIRIISARKATRKERKYYETQRFG